jgi:phage portal protein BeeE
LDTGAFTITGGMGGVHELAPPPARAGVPAESRSFGGLGTGALLGSLRSGAPGAWSDNRMEQARHFIGVAYCAIRAVCEGIAQAELRVTTDRPEARKDDRKRDVKPDGRRHPVGDDDPVVHLLEHPNEEDSLGDLLYELTLQLELTGTALQWSVPNGYGLPCELYVLPTALTTPLPASPEYPRGAYRVNPLTPYGPYGVLPGAVGSGGATIPGEQVSPLRLKHPLLRFDGYAPFSAGGVQVDILEAIDRARWSSMTNGTTPGLLLKSTDAALTDLTPAAMERLQARLDERWANARNYGRAMVLPPGLDASPYTTAPATMGFEAGWEQARDFVGALFGTPKGAMGFVDATNYATLFASLRQFAVFKLGPLARRLARFLTRRVAEPFGGGRRVELELPGLDDPQLLEAQLANDDRSGVRTLNERRALRRLPPWPAPEGDKRVFAGAAAGDKNADGSPEANRPENAEGEGSLGPRHSHNGHARRRW